MGTRGYRAERTSGCFEWKTEYFSKIRREGINHSVRHACSVAMRRIIRFSRDVPIPKSSGMTYDYRRRARRQKTFRTATWRTEPNNGRAFSCRVSANTAKTFDAFSSSASGIRDYLRRCRWTCKTRKRWNGFRSSRGASPSSISGSPVIPINVYIK